MTNLDILLENKQAASLWVDGTVTRLFWKYLDAERTDVIRHLRDAKDMNEVGRYQGDLARIDKILSLRNALKDKVK